MAAATPVTEIVRRVHGERLVVFGWGRALLLQIAHPLVAAAVFEHSAFRASPVVRLLRLRTTLRAMRALTFGNAAAQAAAFARINDVHTRIHGALGGQQGIFPAGTRYSARDPRLLLWVHVTLVESTLLAYETLVEPLPPGQRDAYCHDAAEGVSMLGLDPAGCPRTFREVQELVASRIAGGVTAVSDAARAIGRDIVAPPLAWLAGPAGRLPGLMAIGWLPPPVRVQYGWSWSGDDQATLDRWCARLRRWRGRAPSLVARWWVAR